VREWTFTLPSQLPLWEMESWWILEILESDFKGQNSMAHGVLYIIGKFLKSRCLKWVCITHLDIWNTSYGQKKGRESNYQFDSWPNLKKTKSINIRSIVFIIFYCAYPYVIKFWKIFHIDNLSNASNLHIHSTLVEVLKLNSRFEALTMWMWLKFTWFEPSKISIWIYFQKGS